MSYDTQKGREDLLAFEREQPDNFWRADPHLQRVVRHWAGEDAVAAWEDDLDRFGGECAGPIDRAVRENNLNHNLPVLRRWGPYGDRIEEVEHHPSYHEAGRMIYGSGVMTALGQAGGNLRSQTLGFLSALNGEAGHNCPLACTAGVIKVLRALGSDELKERYLPRLLSRDYEQLAHGAQFLTEVQGGFRRRRQLGARGPRRRRHLAHPRREVVLLQRHRGPDPDDRTAGGRAGGHPRARAVPGPAPHAGGRDQPVLHSPAQGQAGHPVHGQRRARLRRRLRGMPLPGENAMNFSKLPKEKRNRLIAVVVMATLVAVGDSTSD